MQKSFNKTREHFHVPMLLVMINFFVVTVIYYAHGYVNQSFAPMELYKALLSGTSFVLVLISLFAQLEPFTRITYMFSLLTVIYVFWGQ